MQAVYTSIILAILCVLNATGGPGSSKIKVTTPNSVVKPIPTQGTECGISTSVHKVGRIVGGAEAIPHSWPWQVFIVCKNPVSSDGANNKLLFGGSLISDKWIVTTAHAINTTEFDVLRDCTVYLGKHNLKIMESTEEIAPIAKYIVNKYYQPPLLDIGFDLALFKLAKSVKFTDAIKPICLPFGLPELPVGKTCYATGWGRTVHNIKRVSDKLKQLSMPVQEYTYCLIHHSHARLTICTGQWHRQEDTCYGDSGGPLACQESDRKWYLRGVLAHSSVECDSIAISTKVSIYEQFITEAIAQN